MTLLAAPETIRGLLDALARFDEHQPRDDQGRWTDTSGGGLVDVLGIAGRFTDEHEVFEGSDKLREFARAGETTVPNRVRKFNPDQPRDEKGRWTDVAGLLGILDDVSLLGSSSTFDDGYINFFRPRPDSDGLTVSFGTDEVDLELEVSRADLRRLHQALTAALFDEKRDRVAFGDPDQPSGDIEWIPGAGNSGWDVYISQADDQVNLYLSREEVGQMFVDLTVALVADALDVGRGKARRRRTRRDFDPDQQPRDDEGRWTDVPGVGAVSALADSLKLAGKIELDDGETLAGSAKVVGEDGSVRLALTEREGQRSLRIGVGSWGFGGRDDDAGPWRGGPDRTQEVEAERRLLRDERDRLEQEWNDADPERRKAIDTRLEELDEVDLSDVVPSGYTAKLDESTARQLHFVLSDAVARAAVREKALNKAWDERIDLEDRGDRSDAEQARLDDLVAFTDAQHYEIYAEGSVPGEWADVHYRVELDDLSVGSNVLLGAVPPGLDFEDDVRAYERGANLKLAEARKLLRLLDRMFPAARSRRAAGVRDFDPNQPRDPHGRWTDDPSAIFRKVFKFGGNPVAVTAHDDGTRTLDFGPLGSTNLTRAELDGRGRRRGDKNNLRSLAFDMGGVTRTPTGEYVDTYDPGDGTVIERGTWADGGHPKPLVGVVKAGQPPDVHPSGDPGEETWDLTPLSVHLPNDEGWVDFDSPGAPMTVKNLVNLAELAAELVAERVDTGNGKLDVFRDGGRFVLRHDGGLELRFDRKSFVAIDRALSDLYDDEDREPRPALATDERGIATNVGDVTVRMTGEGERVEIVTPDGAIVVDGNDRFLDFMYVLDLLMESGGGVRSVGLPGSRQTHHPVTRHLPGQHNQQTHAGDGIPGLPVSDALGIAGRFTDGEHEVFEGSDRVDGVDGLFAMALTRDVGGRWAIVSTRRPDAVDSWSATDDDEGTAALDADSADELATAMDRVVAAVRRKPDQPRSRLVQGMDWGNFLVRASTQDGEPVVDILTAKYTLGVNDKEYLKDRATDRRQLERDATRDIRVGVLEDAEEEGLTADEVDERVRDAVVDELAEFDQETADTLADMRAKRAAHTVRFTADQAAALRDRLREFAHPWWEDFEAETGDNAIAMQSATEVMVTDLGGYRGGTVVVPATDLAAFTSAIRAMAAKGDGLPPFDEDGDDDPSVVDEVKISDGLTVALLQDGDMVVNDDTVIWRANAADLVEHLEKLLSRVSGAQRGGRPSFGRHLPGEHDQQSHAGDGIPGVDPKLDKLKLAGRIELADGETLVASDQSPDTIGDGSAVMALLATPKGPRLILGFVHAEDTRKWRAEARGSTIEIDMDGVSRVRDTLAELDATGRREAAAMNERVDAYFQADSPLDFAVDVELTDDDPTTWRTRIGVTPDKDYSVHEAEFFVDFEPKDVRRLIRRLDAMAELANAHGKSRTIRLARKSSSRHLPGEHSQEDHGNRPGSVGIDGLDFHVGDYLHTVYADGTYGTLAFGLDQAGDVRVAWGTANRPRAVDLGNAELADMVDTLNSLLDERDELLDEAAEGTSEFSGQDVFDYLSFGYQDSHLIELRGNGVFVIRFYGNDEGGEGSQSELVLDPPFEGDDDTDPYDDLADLLAAASEILEIADEEGFVEYEEDEGEPADELVRHWSAGARPTARHLPGEHDQQNHAGLDTSAFDSVLDRLSLAGLLGRIWTAPRAGAYQAEDGSYADWSSRRDDGGRIFEFGDGNDALAMNVSGDDMGLFHGMLAEAVRTGENDGYQSEDGASFDLQSDDEGDTWTLSMVDGDDEIEFEWSLDQLRSFYAVLTLDLIAELSGELSATKAERLRSRAVEVWALAHVLGDDPPDTDRPGVSAQTGAMVALVPSQQDAARLAVDGGEPAEQLHLTLWHLGEAADVPSDAQQAIVDGLRDLVGGAYPGFALPPVGNGFAVSMFNPPTMPSNDADRRDPCVVLGLGGADLDIAHAMVSEVVREVEARPAGFTLPPQHAPWHPHITLAYTDDIGVLQQIVDRVGPVIFDRLRVAFAGEVVDIPLVTQMTRGTRQILDAISDAVLVDDEDELDDAALTLLAALEEFERQQGMRVWDAELHPKWPKGHPQGGKFRPTVGVIVEKLGKWMDGDRNSDPFEGYGRETLRKVAKKRGIEVRRGADRDEIAKALLDDLESKEGAHRRPEGVDAKSWDTLRALASGDRATVEDDELPGLMDTINAVKPATFNLAKLQVVGEGNQNLFRRHLSDERRKTMPQLPTETGPDLDRFEDFLRSNGVRFAYGHTDPRRLVATQSELSGPKVAKLFGFMRDGGWKKGGVLIMSRDGAVIDGHHRWAGAAAASVARGGTLEVDTLVLDLDWADALRAVKPFAKFEDLATDREVVNA